MPHIFPTIRQTLIATSVALFSVCVFFLFSPAALADTIHCGCQPSASAPTSMMTVPAGQKLCYDIDSSKLANPTDCSTLPSNAGLGNTIVCDKAPLTPTQAQPVSKGICAQGPQPAAAAASTAASDAVSKSNQNAVPQMAIPVLNTDIPGFVAPTNYGTLFGNYIIAIYRYGLSVVVVVATVMFIWGAFLYLLGSGGIGSIQKGKSIMTDAIIGMLLVFGANLILRTLNPSTVVFTSLNPSEIKNIPSDLIGSPYAPDFLSSLGAAPTANANNVPTYGIPTSCPTRWPGLTQDVIDKYLQEQQRTGVPAAVIIAQMYTETGGTCSITNLFKGPDALSKCGYFAKYYNFGGIGCTQKQVPNNSCVFLAVPGHGLVRGSQVGFDADLNFVNTNWNSKQSNASVCTSQAATQNISNFSSYDCGQDCFPIKSHTTVFANGVEYWPPAIQCSRKFSGPQAFLDSHLSAVRPCLSYNDSVYSFAYCIGASTYASALDKAKVLANIIEQNCLCDPEKDSSHCVRNKELESKISQGMVQKINLFKYYSQGKFDQGAADRIAEALYKATGGALYPSPNADPNSDVVTPVQ